METKKYRLDGPKPKTVKAVYYVFSARCEGWFESVHDAMIAAWYACEYNTAYYEEIIDGDKVYNRDDMYKYWDEHIEK